MATLESKIKVKMELRPCYVDGKKALFHKWITINNGFTENTQAIVECENGTVETVDPTRIKFADNKLNEYAF